MKKILAMVLMMAVLVCPAFASGEASAEEAPAAQDAAAVPHYALQVVQEATCTENGVSAYVDSETGEVLFTFETPATGHEPGSAAPTCTDAVVCAKCGEVLEPATGHNYTYQYDAVRNEDGSFASFGTWKCDKCGDVVEATEGNAVYYYAEEAAGEAAPGEEPADAASAADAAPVAEPSGEASEAAGEAAPVSNPNYDPAAHNWASIEIILALVIVAVGAILMLSFGKKKNG